MSRGAQIAKNAVALTMSKVGTMGLNFAVWVHFARVLEPEGVGVLTFGLSLLSYFLVAVALGFDPIGVREIARDHARVPGLTRTMLGARLALCAVALPAYILLVLALPQPPQAQRVLLILSGLLVTRAIRLDWVYEGVERMGTIAYRDVGTSFVVAAGAFTFVREPDHVVWAAIALVAAPVLSNVALLVAYVREHGIPWPTFEREAWMALLIPAIPLATSSFVSEIYYSLDKVMLEFLRSTEEVGLYGIAHKVLSLAIAPASVLAPAFFPALSSAVANPEERVRRGTDHAHMLLMCGLPVAAAGVVLAPGLVESLFGAEYADAIPALRLLLVNAGIVYASMAYGLPLMAWDRQIFYMRAVLAGGVANVILNLALIGPFGIVGAAIATTGSAAIVFVGMAYGYYQITERLHGSLWLRSALAAVFGAGLPAAAAVATGLPFWITVPLLVLTTLVALRAVGLVSMDLVRSVLARP